MSAKISITVSGPTKDGKRIADFSAIPQGYFKVHGLFFPDGPSVRAEVLKKGFEIWKGGNGSKERYSEAKAEELFEVG